MEKTTVLEFLQHNQSQVEKELASLEWRVQPAALYDPVRYVLAGKGKRLRPHLVMATADMFGGDSERAVKVGAAMEVFHIFTLVHDDIMDRASERRGQKTIHIKWNEPTAILAGDYLLGMASELLLHLPDSVLKQGLTRFGQTVRELCEGQIRDMEFETESEVSLKDYLEMIDQKTSALLKTSLALGAMIGEAPTADIECLDEIGFHLGRAFQIQDDLLDLTAASPSWGKPIGGDLIAGKKAFLLLEAMRLEKENGTRNRYFHDIALNKGLIASEIPHAKALLHDLGVLETAQKSVVFHSTEAATRAAKLPDSIGKKALVDLIDTMSVRGH